MYKDFPELSPKKSTVSNFAEPSFTTILNALSAVLLPAVALAVNDTVVSPPTSFGSPVIWPLAEPNDNPADAKFPVVSEYAIVSPSGSEATIVAWVTFTSSKASPTLPADVVQLGALSTFIWLSKTPDNPPDEVTLTS